MMEVSEMGSWESTGKSDEWYTPKYIFDALGVTFDLDVAHPASADTFVPCKAFYSERSLDKEWFGFVWMNPPYGGRGTKSAWLKKFIEHGNGLALLPDMTSASWFHDTFPKIDVAIFTKRIKFIDINGNEGRHPSNGSVILGIGSQAVNAIERCNLGVLAYPKKQDGGE